MLAGLRQVLCPLDGRPAEVGLIQGVLTCSLTVDGSGCPSTCEARAALLHPERPHEVRLLCPKDGQPALLRVVQGRAVECSRERFATCSRACICYGP